MKKVSYVTPYFFLDVDFPIVPLLAHECELKWHVLLHEDNRRYNRQEVTHFTQSNGINATTHKMSGRARGLSQLIFSYRFLKKLRSEKADVYYLEYMSDPYFYLLSLLLLPRKNTIVALHDVEPHSDYMPWTHRLFNKLILKSFLNYHFFSRSQSTIFEKKYGGRYFCIPMAPKDFGAAQSCGCDIADGCKLLFFGTIHSYKGLDLLIEACEQLTAERVAARFSVTIAGNGPVWMSCRELIRTPSVFDLKIEYIENSEVADLFTSHHFLILPYRDVTQSGPLMISYAYELPAVVSDEKGFLEYVEDGVDGMIFSSGSVEALKEKLRTAVTMGPADYERMKNALSRKVKKEYSRRELALKYIDMFNCVSDEK